MQGSKAALHAEDEEQEEEEERPDLDGRALSVTALVHPAAAPHPAPPAEQ